MGVPNRVPIGVHSVAHRLSSSLEPLNHVGDLIVDLLAFFISR